MKLLLLPCLVGTLLAGCATTEQMHLTPEEIEKREERQEARAFFHEPRMSLPER